MIFVGTLKKYDLRSQGTPKKYDLRSQGGREKPKKWTFWVKK